MELQINLQIKAVRLVNSLVDQTGLQTVDSADGLHSTMRLEPLENQTAHVNAECGRRLEQGAVGRLHFVVEYGRTLVDGVAEEIVAYDDKRDASRSEVLLRAGEYAAVFGDVDGSREQVRRAVGHDRHRAGHGAHVEVELDSIDGLVLAQVNIRSLRVERPLLNGRNRFLLNKQKVEKW